MQKQDAKLLIQSIDFDSVSFNEGKKSFLILPKANHIKLLSGDYLDNTLFEDALSALNIKIRKSSSFDSSENQKQSFIISKKEFKRMFSRNSFNLSKLTLFVSGIVSKYFKEQEELEQEHLN